MGHENAQKTVRKTETKQKEKCQCQAKDMDTPASNK